MKPQTYCFQKSQLCTIKLRMHYLSMVVFETRNLRTTTIMKSINAMFTSRVKHGWVTTTLSLSVSDSAKWASLLTVAQTSGVQSSGEPACIQHKPCSVLAVVVRQSLSDMEQLLVHCAWGTVAKSSNIWWRRAIACHVRLRGARRSFLHVQSKQTLSA